MSISVIKGKNVDVHLWAPVHEVESSALDQLKNVAALPWVFHHVAAMADAHYGIGATVGSVIAMKNAVAPAAVGVDLGCGMLAAKTNLDADKVARKIKQIRSAIEEAVPVGFAAHEEPAIDRVQSLALRNRISQLMDRFDNLDRRVQDRVQKVWKQIGTLGGGNHFIEVSLDTANNVWLMLHSGSRNVGKELAEEHIGVARCLAHNAELPDCNLAVFLAGTPQMARYRHDLFWAQEYALLNREVMFDLCQQVLQSFWPSLVINDLIACHHNYVAEEIHFGEQVLVTRKGAIHAGRGIMGIIPGSMATNSYIVRGLGNPESFESASHGAGRRMSRGKAKKKFTVDDLVEQTQGIECRKDKAVIDEIPGAYKDIRKVAGSSARARVSNGRRRATATAICLRRTTGSRSITGRTSGSIASSSGTTGRGGSSAWPRRRSGRRCRERSGRRARKSSGRRRLV